MNEDIEAPQVRLINQEGKQLGIVAISEALAEAKKAQLDLVEIVPDAEVPVVRIMDYGKHVFQKKKKPSKVKRKTTKLKEIKFRPGTDVGDYQVKLRALRGFLEAGNKVKVTVWFRGREMAHQQLGADILERVKADLEDAGKVEFFPKLEGRQMTMVLAPNKKS